MTLYVMTDFCTYYPVLPAYISSLTVSAANVPPHLTRKKERGKRRSLSGHYYYFSVHVHVELLIRNHSV
jgi:hypothetical protein